MNVKSLLNRYRKKVTIGWCEWCGLDSLNIPAIKAKVDTGAKTSALHAFDIQPYMSHGKQFVKFKVHPLQGNDDLEVQCRAPVVDVRSVTSSNGHREKRYVIPTTLTLGGKSWEIEITLTDRSPMRFRMLLGREAMGSHIIIMPQMRLHQGKMPRFILRKLYKKNK